MEVEKITVKVEVDGIEIQAVAVLTHGEGSTKKRAAGAAAALCVELRTAMQETFDAGPPEGVGREQNGHQVPLNGFPPTPKH